MSPIGNEAFVCILIAIGLRDFVLAAQYGEASYSFSPGGIISASGSLWVTLCSFKAHGLRQFDYLRPIDNSCLLGLLEKNAGY